MTKSNRYHTTDSGSIHKGPASSCAKCKKLKKQEKEHKPKKPKRSKEGLVLCKIHGCKSTLGPTNTSGYCRECFLRSPAWKNAQQSTFVRVKDA